LAREEEERRQAERGKALERKRGVGRGVSRTVDSSSSGVRGVRGTRASMRARGVATGIARGRTDSSFNSRDCAHVVTSRHEYHFWTREYPSAFFVSIYSDEYDPVTQPRAQLM